MLKKGVEVNILEQRLYVKSDEEEEYIRRVETYLNKKVEEIKNNTKAVSTLDVALLTVLNVAGDYLKTVERLGELENRSTKLAELIERRLV
ncbi:MAG: cell division protein ZapA [Thermodesulfobacteriota bacterium]